MQVRAECPWCGTVELEPGHLRCEVEPSGAQALCEFICPVCSRLVYARTTPEGVLAVRLAGAGNISGVIPFELLEPHDGPALSWDDFLDLRAAIEGLCCPMEELTG